MGVTGTGSEGKPLQLGEGNKSTLYTSALRRVRSAIHSSNLSWFSLAAATVVPPPGEDDCQAGGNSPVTVCVDGEVVQISFLQHVFAGRKFALCMAGLRSSE